MIQYVIKRIFYVYIVQIVTYIVPIVSVPYLLLNLGVESFSYYMLAMSIVSLLVITSNLEISTFGIEKISRNKQDAGGVYFSISLFKFINLSILVFAFSIAVYFIQPVLFLHAIKNHWILIFLPIANTLSTDWLLTAIGRPVISSVIQAISLIFFLLIILIFPPTQSNQLSLNLAWLFSAYLNILFLYLASIILLKEKFSINSFNIKLVINTYKASSGYIYYAVSNGLKTQIGTLVLGAFSTPQEVAAFSIIEKVYISLASIAQQTSKIILVYSGNIITAHSLINLSKIIFYITLCSLAFGFLLEDRLINYFEWYSSISTMILLSLLSIGLYSISLILGFPLFSAKESTHKLKIIDLSSSVFYIVAIMTLSLLFDIGGVEIFLSIIVVHIYEVTYKLKSYRSL